MLFLSEWLALRCRSFQLEKLIKVISYLPTGFLGSWAGHRYHIVASHTHVVLTVRNTSEMDFKAKGHFKGKLILYYSLQWKPTKKNSNSIIYTKEWPGILWCGGCHKFTRSLMIRVVKEGDGRSSSLLTSLHYKSSCPMQEDSILMFWREI